jgi:hypothetical protein
LLAILLALVSVVSLAPTVCIAGPASGSPPREGGRKSADCIYSGSGQSSRRRAHAEFEGLLALVSRNPVIQAHQMQVALDFLERGSAQLAAPSPATVPAADYLIHSGYTLVRRVHVGLESRMEKRKAISVLLKPTSQTMWEGRSHILRTLSQLRKTCVGSREIAKADTHLREAITILREVMNLGFQ